MGLPTVKVSEPGVRHPCRGVGRYVMWARKLIASLTLTVRGIPFALVGVRLLRGLRARV
jgi:hypothetical protein